MLVVGERAGSVTDAGVVLGRTGVVLSIWMVWMGFSKKIGLRKGM